MTVNKNATLTVEGREEMSRRMGTNPAATVAGFGVSLHAARKRKKSWLGDIKRTAYLPIWTHQYNFLRPSHGSWQKTSGLEADR